MTNTLPEGLLDPIVEAVRAKLLHRSQVGIKKYGTMLSRTDLNTLDWLRHAQEEALDQANYLEVLIQREEEKHLHQLAYGEKYQDN